MRQPDAGKYRQMEPKDAKDFAQASWRPPSVTYRLVPYPFFEVPRRQLRE